MTIDENGEQKLKFHGEQVWEPSQSSGGKRTETKHQRGCVSRALEEDQANWKKIVQDIIAYKFRDVDLLGEALESEGSGMATVGKNQRHFLDGNKGLAKVGEVAMTLVLRDQCYLFRVHEGKHFLSNPNRRGKQTDRIWIDDAKKTIKKMMEDYDDLYQLGMTTKLQQYIRPRAPLRPSQKWSFMANIKDDFQGLGKDAPRAVAIGIKALIGAVYFDGGYESTRRVMAHLGHIGKLSEAKPAPVPNFGHNVLA
jgi:hypothetical protein